MVSEGNDGNEKKEENFSRTKKRVIIWMSLIVVLSLGLYLGFIFYANAGDVRKSLAKIELWWFAPVLVLSFSSYVVRALRWHYYLNRLDVDIDHKGMLMLYLAGLSMLITPAMISGVVKVGLVKAKLGTEFSRTLPIVVVERLTDLVGMIALAMIGIFFFGEGYISITGTVIFLVVTLAFVHNEWCREKILTIIGWIPGLRNYVNHFRKLIHSARKLLDRKSFTMGSLYGFVSWGLIGISMYLLILGMDMDLNFPEALFIFALPSILGIMSQLPGGLGMEEGTMMSLFVHKDVELADATALVLLYRLVTLWFGLVIGIIALFVFARTYDKEEKFNKNEGIGISKPVIRKTDGIGIGNGKMQKNRKKNRKADENPLKNDKMENSMTESQELETARLEKIGWKTAIRKTGVGK